MALWGQGDPRWQVESRTDGTNVAGWHWAEINRIDWTKRRLAELLPGLAAEAEAEAIDDAPLSVRITSVKSVTGEAMLTTRKSNKRFAYYDLKITLGWEAVAPEAAATAAAEIEALDVGPHAATSAATDASAATELLAASSLSSADGGSPEAGLEEAQQPDQPQAGDAEPAAEAGSAGEPVAADGAALGANGGDAAAAAAVVAAPAVTGEITVGEFGSGSDHDDLEVSVTAAGGDDAAKRERLRRHAQAALLPLVLRQLDIYVRELGDA
ncbi:hypothetical protein D9Q98_002932 [Chlorella vulgaris]|uniref:Activator of Hsp90 ATPase AHSA1-like N-terminal domain-containing protein n=1 Tax=Chlorella vulgaris TaxID=3077 RepID=A0A9D4TUU0_CHLVU|nr:hypothetical protein D9Q98_002932 [Chlorella vulgaris]